MSIRFHRAPVILLFSLLTVLAGGAQAAHTICKDSIDTGAPVLSNGFGFNPSNTRNQASAIRADNVAQLRLDHTHVAEGSKEKRSAPAVTEQTIYFAEAGDIVAANRTSGCEYWRYKGAARNKPMLGGNPIRSSSILYVPPSAPHVAMVFAGDFKGHFYGVDARTGQEVWQGFMGTDPARHMITGSAQAHQGTLFVPVASNEVVSTVVALFSPCCESHGLLRALDMYTGRIKWTYHTTQDAKDNVEAGTRGPSGMSLWSTPLIDEANHAVLVGTGQNLSLPTTNNSDAIISLDMDSGKVKWVFQSTKGDAWNAACQAPPWLSGHCPQADGKDFDFGAPPVLATLPNGGKAILAGGKNGVVYSLDPKTGALNWSTRLGVGGSLGGIHWGLAVDATKVYAGVTDIWVNKMSRLAIGDLLTGGLLANMQPVPGARPGLYALDLVNGKVVWEKHIQHTFEGRQYNSLYSAALTVTNDVLLAGSLGGVVKALRTSDGQELWSYDTAVKVVDVHGVEGHGGTIDSVGPVPAGKDLLVNSGYSTFGGANAWQGGKGNALFVFRLP
jgi:polyvinyl alcohol dehydrogenase (cytochrome)